VHDDGLVLEVSELPIDEQCGVSAVTAATALPRKALWPMTALSMVIW
jgi:hypothetical protein